jgi:tetratricopeptide (TPR) repeat protein
MTNTNQEIPEDLYSGIKRLCEAGDEAADSGRLTEALGLYHRALALLPSEPTEWEAATWIHAAIGDAYFFMRDLRRALSAFEQALRSPGGIGNPFLHLRRGQILFDMGQEKAAADELARAYMAEGEAIFTPEDTKYLAFVKSVLRPPA